MFGRRRRPRRGRVDLGKYVRPAEPPPLPPVEAVAEEGMMLALSAVRMPVKNRMILNALRDKADYDEAETIEYARERMLDLAREKEADADRTGRQLGTPGERNDDTARSRRREQVSRLLAEQLREASADEQLLRKVVTDAREAAWAEISKSWMVKFTQQGVDVDAEDYRRNRDLRLRQLIRVDLAQLARDSEPEY